MYALIQIINYMALTKVWRNTSNYQIWDRRDDDNDGYNEDGNDDDDDNEGDYNVILRDESNLYTSRLDTRCKQQGQKADRSILPHDDIRFYPDRPRLPSLYILPPTSAARSFLKHQPLRRRQIEKQREQKMRRTRLAKAKVIDGIVDGSYPDRESVHGKPQSQRHTFYFAIGLDKSALPCH